MGSYDPEKTASVKYNLAQHIFLPWRWRQQIPQKHWYMSTTPQNNTAEDSSCHSRRFENIRSPDCSFLKLIQKRGVSALSVQLCSCCWYFEQWVFLDNSSTVNELEEAGYVDVHFSGPHSFVNLFPALRQSCIHAG